MKEKIPFEHIPESAHWQSFVDVLRTYADVRPNQVAYIYLKDGEIPSDQVTFAQLDARVRAIAATLQQYTHPGDRALLMFAPGIEYIAAFLACLYAGVVAIPAYPPRNKRYLSRFQSIVADSQTSLALTSSDLAPDIQRMFGQTQGLQMLRLVISDEIDPAQSDAWLAVAPQQQSLAFLQYTSGSTGQPKGVMVSHGNLLHNESLILDYTQMGAEHGIVSWLPPYHDMGLILGLLCPLYLGSRAVLMAPFAFIQSPYRWLKAISDYSDLLINSGAPNFAYDLCVRWVTDAQKETLDLSRWDIAFNGAEPISAQTFDSFAQSFAACGFNPDARLPVYGLAEATLMTSGGPSKQPMLVLDVDRRALQEHQVKVLPEGPDTRQCVGCGQFKQSVRIIDPETRLECPETRIGEVWISGPSVATGYWNRPEETVATFQARIKGARQGDYLRTGDLGFIQQGQLFVTGRIKDVIIVRGRNHYPQDIEQTVALADPSQGKGITPIRVGHVAAVTVIVEHTEKVVVIAEVARQYLHTCRRFQEQPQAQDVAKAEYVSDYRTLDPNIVVGVIRREVAQAHDIQLYAVVLIRPERLPKTSSGKIQHHQCALAYMNGTLPMVWHSEFSNPNVCHDDIVAIVEQIPPEEINLDRLLIEAPDQRRQWLEQVLREHIARSLHVAPRSIEAEQPLSHFGIDSLLAVELGHLIESGFGVIIDSVALLDGMSLRALTETLLSQLSDEAQTDIPQLIKVQEARDEYPLSQGQRAMWFIHRFAPENLAYSVNIAAKIEQAINIPILQRAFQALLDRHPSLRATYHSKDGEPVAEVQHNAQLFFTLEDGDGWGEQAVTDRMKQLAVKPFDLAHGPLFRVHVVTEGACAYILMSAHHIAVDMWSVVLMMDELKIFYPAYLKGESVTLPALPYRYTDYVQWQIQLLKSDAGQRLWLYWKDKLAGCYPILELPTDHPRGSIQTYHGDTHFFALNAALTSRIQAFAKETRATVFMVLLAAFQEILHRYTGQNDLLVGTPVAGRSRAGLEGVVGYFVDPVVLRAQFQPRQTFYAFMAEVRETVLGALKHQDYPFAEIVKRIYPIRDPSRSPLFQAMFVLQKAYQPEHESIAGFVLGEKGGHLTMADITLQSMPVHTHVAMFDIMLTMTQDNGRLLGSFQYNTDLYEHSTIAIMALHLETLLQGLLSEPENEMRDIPLMAEADRYLLTVEWNENAVDYALHRPLHVWFEQQVEQTPNRTAVLYEQQALRYSELNARANQLAHVLIGQGVGSDQLVGVCLHRSLDMVVAILGVMKAGAGYLPLDPGYPAERLNYMCDDSNIAVVLTQSTLQTVLVAFNGVMLTLDDNDFAEQATENPNIDVQPEQLAYVIYTSGSTGKPKGVMIPHRAIVNHMLWMTDALALDATDRVLQKTPFSFDASIWEFFAPLMRGAVLVMAKPEGHRDAQYLIDAIKHFSITTIQLVPSALRMLLETTGIETITSLRRVCCGGEALTVDLQQRFFDLFDIPLYNLYGPTEAAVDSAYWQCDANASHTHVPIGRPIANTAIYILDKALNPVPVGVPGEIHIGGAGLANGYLNRPELTAERFIDNPFCVGERLYKTGDLGRYLQDGSIEFLGRIDHQVKLRGYRIELGEIETALCEQASIRQCVTMVREDTPGNKRLVSYVTTDPTDPPSAEVLRQYLQSRLPIYMIPSDYVTLDAFPLMPNGKIDRQALPAPTGMLMDDAYVAPRTPLELALVNIWGDVLGAIRVGVEDNFFAFGGHSLLATQVVARIYDQFSLDVPVRALFEYPTILGLADHIEKHYSHARALPKSEISIVARDGHMQVSFAQQRLWFLHQLLKNPAVYNMPAAIRLRGEINQQALQQSLDAIVAHHEVLRTGFISQQGAPAAVVAPDIKVLLQIVHVQGENLERRLGNAKIIADEEAAAPFSLDTPPLLRAKLLILSEGDCVFLFTMHHIVSDGWSLGVFCSEFMTAYKAFTSGKSSPLKHLPIQYADFAAWQQQWLTGDVLRAQIDFWKAQLGERETIPVLNLPTDYPRPLVQSYHGAQCQKEIPFELVVGLEELSERQGASLAMTLFTAFNVLLYRYSGQKEIIVGFPIANRTRVEVEKLIGLFVNTLAIKTVLQDDSDFEHQLRSVRDVFLGAFSHQDAPYEKLVDELGAERDTSRTPLFQVMFTMQNTPLEEFKLPGVEAQLFDSHNATAKFDLWLSLSETQYGMRALLEYNTDLFEESTMQRMIDQYLVLLEHAVRYPEQPISKLSLLPDMERTRVLEEWNDTTVEFPEHVCVHQLFEDQVEYNPTNSAVKIGRASLSYQALNDKANQLAHWLRLRNIGPNVRVGVHLPRSIEFAISILAVIKAGGVYVPLDEACPQERMGQMLDDAGIGLLITDSRVGRTLKCANAEYFYVDRSWAEVLRLSSKNLISGVTTNDPIYQVYTSGATGRIKGVVVPHRAAYNHMQWMQSTFGLDESDKILLRSPFSFDASIWEFWAPLISGALLILDPTRSSYRSSLAYLGGTIAQWKQDYDLIEPISFPVEITERGQWRQDTCRLDADLRRSIEGYCTAQDLTLPEFVLSLQAWLIHYYCRPLGHFPILNVDTGVLYILSSELFHEVASISELWERLKGCRRTYATFPQLSGISEDQPVVAGRTQFFITQQNVHRRDEKHVWLLLQEQGDELQLTISYHSRHFTDFGFLGQMQHLIVRMLEAQTMRDLSLSAQRTQIDPVDGFTDIPVTEHLLARFCKMRQAYPQQVAVCCGDVQLTYAELDVRANQLANGLISKGVLPETFVALLLDRTVDIVVAILGVLKTGACYVPIDARAPDERIRWILTDSDAPWVVTQAVYMNRLSELASIRVKFVQPFDHDIAAQSSQAPDIDINPASLAYVIYTSGSTGKPKGVMVEHRQVVRLMDATQQWFHFSHNDVWTLFHSYAFDFSVWEIWGALFYGGRLVIIPYLLSCDPREFYELIKKERVTVLNQTPSAFYQLIRAEEQSLRTNATAVEQLSLRAVVFGGEQLDFRQLKPWIDRHGDDHPKLINMYGITETTVHVTYREIRTEDIEMSIRMMVNMSYIGRPMQDLFVLILDAQNRPTAIGAPGELCVAGAGVSRGYLHREGLTASRFIELPGVIGKVYRSGDLGRYLSNGEIEYLGRIDHQVQLRGFRIELGEIEAAIGAFPGVRENVAMVREDIIGDQRIVSYIVKQDAFVSNDVRHFVQTILPDYMIPSQFLRIDSIPLTGNGKINYKALPRPDQFDLRMITTFNEISDAKKLIKTIIKEQITVLQVVPTLLREMVAQSELSDCDSLKILFCGGEVFPQELATQVFSRLNCALYNLYGPAEATIDTTFGKAQPGYLGESVPIGQPISNCQVYVLDMHQNIVPIGVVGELYIGGMGLALGYHRQQALTDAAFVPNPFSSNRNNRLYKTGDLVRWLATGDLEFVGRIDQQVKLRGYRVEMEEIENILNEHPAIHESVVMAHKEADETILVAYLVSSIIADRVVFKIACKACVEGYDPIMISTQDISRRGLKLSGAPSYWRVGLRITLELDRYPQMGSITGNIVWRSDDEVGVLLEVSDDLGQVSEMIRGIVVEDGFDLFDLRRIHISDPRRACLRVPFHQTCQLKLLQSGKICKVEAEDLSVGFMRVRGVPGYCNNDDVSIALMLPGEHSISWYDGRVLWVHSHYSTVQLKLDRQAQLRFYKSILYVMQSEHYWLSVHTLGHLRHYLKGYFPDFMIPKAFVQLDGLPLLENGKVDRASLPAPEQIELHEKQIGALQTETERSLEKIWCAVLNVEKIGRAENFFELGGHSLLVTQVLARILDQFTVHIALQQFFDDPTIEGLSDVIDHAEKIGALEKLPDIKPVAKKSRRRRKPKATE